MPQLVIVIGLGNPGKEYENNRHNAGFVILDAFALLRGFQWSSNKKILSEIIVSKDDGLILLKPQTFMNNSGSAVSKAFEYFKIPPQNLIVIHDDVDLPPLQFKTSQNSTSAGHHGVQSIIDAIKTTNFTRIRVGVGRPIENSREVEKYVLNDFSPEELARLKKEGIEHLLSSFKV